MTIESGDIKLVASQSMLDADQGGGAPTSTVINDGTSNSIFPDISEVDRAGGRVNLRKVFASVQTSDRDQYFGANVIVADPPDDPNVSVNLFTTNDVFDRRTDARDRIESYLAVGSIYSGYLFGNHITGMRTVTILQREEVPVPVVGDTFVLRAFEGLTNEVEQYVRVSDVSTIVRTFSDQSGDFKRLQVTMEITDALRSDFPGFDAIRTDATINYTGRTKTYTTIVADAARYYGVVPLEVATQIGDFTLKAETIFTQLVPSTRFEVPIADARMNRQSATLVSAGQTYNRTISMTFTTSQSMFIGGGILPGSLSVTRGGITITDQGGTLRDSGNAQVGTVDYENGVLALQSNVFGTGTGAHTVVYTPARKPIIVTDSIGIPVTAQSQRLSYTLTIDPIPARGSLEISYRVLNRWYTLTDDGSGTLRGSDVAFGAGTLNYTTGGISVTLGALPDVDSQVIFAFTASAAVKTISQVQQAGPALARAFGKPITIGQAVKPGTLVFTWNDGTNRTATDSAGVLTGDATGTVDYATGTVVFRPNILPAKNTNISLAIQNITSQNVSVLSLNDGGANWTFGIAGPVEPRSVEIAVTAFYQGRLNDLVDLSARYFPIRVTDDGAGNLVTGNGTNNLTVGIINYTNGACQIGKSFVGYKAEIANFAPTQIASTGGGLVTFDWKRSGSTIVNATLNIMNGPGSFSALVESAPWAWWNGTTGNAALVRYANGSANNASFPFLFDEIFLPNNANVFTVTPGYTPKLSSFFIGTNLYLRRENDWVVNPDPTTGNGTTVGSEAIISGIPGVLLTAWTSGLSSAPLQVAGTADPSASGASTPLIVSGVTFRTAVAPLFNGGFSIAGNWLIDNTTVNATANSAGVVSTGTAPPDASTPGSYGVFGTVDYDSGVVQLRFGRRVPLSMAAADGVVDVSDLGVPGVTLLQTRSVRADTLRYNATGYAYLPLDANLLGLDPVRLPSDGRVPIFRPGTFAVIGHTGTVGPVTVSAAQTVNCGRVRLSRVRVIGADNQVINTGYTVNLDLGTVTFTDVTGYSQPVRIEHRIEDMMLVSDAQINGQLTFTRAVTHNYPVPGTYVSSALVAGDLYARVAETFDQATWNNVWSDSVIGTPATGTFNDIQYPIVVTNRGALTERWALQFVNNTNFNIIGEHVGVIGQGNTSTNCAPLNPATGEPYFTIPFQGWGLGWSTGNVLRINTVGAFYPVWVARTILQGPETVINDSFTILIRGDVDRP